MQKIMFNDRYGLTQAVIEGRKTMTRRVLSGYPLTPSDRIEDAQIYPDGSIGIIANGGESLMEVKYRYRVGEIVAVAQSYRDVLAEGFESDAAVLRAFEQRRLVGWTNKMFVKPELMPHRIRITGIGVERLQDISDEDCLREGIYPYYYGDAEEKKRYDIPPDGYSFDSIDCHYPTPREAFASLIDKVSGRGTWKSNPWVFVCEFELLK